MSAAALSGVGLIIFVLAWFQPQKLFLNRTVSEPLPGVIQMAPAGQADGSVTAGGSPPAGLQVVRSGRFRSLERASTGPAIVWRLPGGRLVPRLERLSTSTGPDLRVDLSHVPAGGDRHAYRTGFIDRGALNGHRGSQNSASAAGTDLPAFNRAVICCRRFAAGFAVAPLSPRALSAAQQSTAGR